MRPVPTMSKLLIAASLAFAASCGGAGESDQKPCALCGEMNDLLGSIATQSGSQQALQDWVVVALQKDGVARVGVVDAAGLYQLGRMRTNQAHTLALLSPDYIVQSVLSIPNPPSVNTIKQFFTVQSQSLPALVHRGPIITFQDLKGIQPTNDLASDANGDGIPDGMVSLGAAPVTGGVSLVSQELRERHGMTGEEPRYHLMLQGAAIDIDLDGVPNAKDPDIDGDGVVNWLDPDDNGNGIVDVFDGDANGDLINDTDPRGHNTDLYFPEGVEWISVQLEMRPKTDGSGMMTVLTFATRVRDEVTPLAVQVRGAPSLLNGSTIIAKQEDGTDSIVSWNRLLIDDGKSNDNNPGDRIFGQRVLLENAKTPRAHEVVFVELVFGSFDAPWYMNFPYTFPDVKLAPVTAQYDVNTRTVLLVGNPFKDIQDFSWAINVYDETDRMVWSSGSIPGANRQFQIQENVLAVGQSYKFDVQAFSRDKIPTRPGYTIYSQKYELR